MEIDAFLPTDFAIMANKMTDKMKAIYLKEFDELASLPVQIKEYIFGTNQARRIALEIQTTNYIVLELIKYSFDFNDPTYPLSYFLKKYDADDSERMLQSRIVQYAMKYKKRELLRNHIDIPSNHKFANIEMKSIDQKLNGYRFTEMNFFEHQNIHNIEIIKAIVENRIGSAKKISNQRFMEMFKQYDNMVEGLLERSAKSDRDCVFSSLALFTLEWQYSIETLYDLACLMEEKEICDINISDLALLCGRVTIESRFVGWVNTDSRMVKERSIVLNDLLLPEIHGERKELLRNRIKEVLVAATKLYAYEQNRKWFMEETTQEDWASFFRYYDMFSIWKKKKWTRKRIQYMRRLLDLVNPADDTPKN